MRQGVVPLRLCGPDRATDWQVVLRHLYGQHEKPKVVSLQIAQKKKEDTRIHIALDLHENRKSGGFFIEEELALVPQAAVEVR